MDAATMAQPAAPRVATLDTSSASLAQVGLRKMAKQQQEIHDVVLSAQRNGAHDMSLTEIRDLYERIHGKRIDLNRVSARVTDLVAARRLERRQDTRACSVTGRPIHPVHIPPSQERLFA